MQLSQSQHQQLQELSSLDNKQLNDLRQQFLRYFGQHSQEIRLVAMEIRRRRSIRPKLKSVLNSLRKKVTQLYDEMSRINNLTFDGRIHFAYDRLTLKPVSEAYAWQYPDDTLTSRMAYRVACERLKEIEANIRQLEEHIHIITQACQVNSLTLDLMEAHGIDLDRNKRELNKRLHNLKQRSITGTAKPKPTMFKHTVPEEEPLGPKAGDYLTCPRTKNFKAGTYQIVTGGVGFNRYYCRKLIEELEPQAGYRLFITCYIGGFGHYIISVPESCCFPKALGYSFTRSVGASDGYFTRLRKTYPFIDKKLKP